MNVKKQDRQGVRTPADLERKYELNLIGKGGGGGGASGDISSLEADLASLTTYTYARLGELEIGKANQSGWTPNKYLGTNKDGNIEEKDAPESSGGIASDIKSAIVLTDQSTGKIYNLYMLDGGLMLGESKGEVLPPSLDATLTDNTTNTEYKLYVFNGKLMLKESEDENGDTNT